MNRVVVTISCLIALFCTIETSTHAKEVPGKGPVKVFIMAGPSNMEGHGKSIHIKMAAEDEKTRAEFSPLLNGEDYAVRKDVWITWGSKRQGELSIGWGAEYGRDGKGKVGTELGFGWQMGELLDEQVLLIKWAAGGHSLKKNFLPPSAGGPLESYTLMVDEVHRVLDNLKTIYPDYDEKLGYEIVGLVWFQAWNDLCDGSQWKEKPHYKSYNERQAALLRDLRKEFKAPEMLMVIGELGAGSPTHQKHVAFRETQRAMTLTDEFENTTRSVPTLPFWDIDPRFRSNQDFHYRGNGKTYYFIGKAMALAMSELLQTQASWTPSER